MKSQKFTARFFALLVLLLSLTSLLFAGCGKGGTDATSQGTVPAGSETAETTEATVATTVREVTIVGDRMRHMNYNIAGSNTLERIPNFDLNETKRSNIKSIIEEIDPDTFGIQEAPKAWIEGMVGLLDNRYALAGGYTEAYANNEKAWVNPIYYKVDTFKCLDEGVIFLNDTFAYNSNKSTRNCSYALLERLEDGELVLILSTHLEHRALGTDELKTYNYTSYYQNTSDRNLLRDEQIGYLVHIVTTRLEEYAKTYSQEISVVISGDFNINAWQDEGFEHEYTRLCETFGAAGLYDTVKMAPNLVTNQAKQKWRTYRDYFTTDCADARLDYIFVTNNISVDSFTVYNTTAEMGDSSDHHPVYADYYIGH